MSSVGTGKFIFRMYILFFFVVMMIRSCSDSKVLFFSSFGCLFYLCSLSFFWDRTDPSYLYQGQ